MTKCAWCSFAVADGSETHSRCRSRHDRGLQAQTVETRQYEVGPRRRLYMFLRITDPVTGSVRVTARNMDAGPDGTRTHLWEGKR